MKINLEKNEEDALASMIASGGNHIPVLRKLFSQAIDDLKDITNIDPKANVGLQTCARQEAVKQLIEIESKIFPDPSTVKKEPGVLTPKVSKYL